MTQNELNKKINNILDSCKVKQAIFFNSSSLAKNFYYLTELPFGLFKGNILVIEKNKKPIIFSSILEKNWLEKKGFNVIKLESKKQFISEVKKLLKFKKIGTDFSEMTAEQLTRTRRMFKGKILVDLNQTIKKEREIKTKNEIRKLKKAVSITEKTLYEIKEVFKKGMTERSLMFAIEKNAKDLGGDFRLSFEPIVALGKNASVPHHVSGKTKLTKGLLLVDFGVRFENYCADLTRIYSIGKPSENQQEVYDVVFEAKKQAEKTIKKGIDSDLVFNAAQNVLKEKLGKEMPHSLGHGLGLEVHDLPTGIGLKGKFKFKNKMMFTLEPGIYEKTFGIRIEDDYLFDNKLKKLSKAPKEIMRI